MLIKKKVVFLLVCITLISSILTGCYDLGEATKTDEEYCDAYSEIGVMSGSSNITYYEMSDFYSKTAVNEFKSPMEESERREYSYLTIKVSHTVTMDDVAVHFESTVADTLSVSFFVLEENELPTKIYTGPGGDYKQEECNEPPLDKAVATVTCKLSGVENKWKPAWLKTWVDGETATKTREVEGGQYIVLRINNNCYDPSLSALEKAEEEWNKVKEEYDEKAAAWQNVNNNSSATQEERNEAMTALMTATAAKNVADRDYEIARQEYEKNKFPYKKMPVRMTAILIKAE